MLNSQVLFPCADYGFNGVGKVGDDIHLERGLPAVGAKPASCIGDRRSGKLPHDPTTEFL